MKNLFFNIKNVAILKNDPEKFKDLQTSTHGCSY